MTKVQIRFRLERPLDEQTMPRIVSAHSIYGIMRVQVEPSGQELWWITTLRGLEPRTWGRR